MGFIASCTDSNPSNPGAGLDKFALRKRRNSHEHSAQTGVQNPAMIRTLSVWALLHLVAILTSPTPMGLDKFALRKRGNSHEHPAQTGVQNPAMIRTLSVWALLHLVPILTPPTPARGWISLRSASVGIRTNIRRKRGYDPAVMRADGEPRGEAINWAVKNIEFLTARFLFFICAVSPRPICAGCDFCLRIPPTC